MPSAYAIPMHRRSFLRVFSSASAFVVLLTACGAGTTPPAIDPNAPRIEFSTKPTQPGAGEVEMIVDVTDPAGEIVEGADVYVSYAHLGMNMGTQEGRAVEQSNGRYSLKAQLSMNGDYKVTIQVDKKGLPQGIKEVKLGVQ